MIKSIIVPINPMGKPRMTQKDKWARRPVVLRYFKFKDDINKYIKDIIPKDVYDLSWTAYIEMPKSWSKKKKNALMGMRHRQKPDRDNVDKAILDSIFKEDSIVSDGCLKKRWDDGEGPRIEISWK